MATLTFIQGLQALLRSGTDLPTLPDVVFRLHAVLDDEHASGHDVAAVIERDPALTARLLRVANSAAFSRGGDRLASPLAAIQRLGISQVRAICLVLAVVQAFGERRRSFDPRAFWRHSAAVGAVARTLWERLHGRGPAADDAYVAGLLHDVGVLILDQFFSAEFDAVLSAREELDIPLWQQEEDQLGMDHGQVGGLLLGSWSLPAAVVDAVTSHHTPREAPEPHLALCRVVHASEAVCAALGAGLPHEGPSDVPAAEALQLLGFGAGELEALLGELRATATAGRDAIG